MTKAALQLYSIKDLMQKDVYEALEHTSVAGYDGVEFAGFFDQPAIKIKSKMDELNLMTCGSHTSWDLLNENIDEVFEYNKVLDNKNIVLPFIDEKFRQSAKDWEEMDLDLEKILGLDKPQTGAGDITSGDMTAGGGF